METHNSFIKEKRGRNMSCNVFSWKESSLAGGEAAPWAAWERGAGEGGCRRGGGASEELGCGMWDVGRSFVS